MEPEEHEHETAEERRRRWIERAAAQADLKVVRCAKCGKETNEFTTRAGRMLCIECYLDELEESSSMDMPEAGCGGG
jgi:protein-arginine kinase activator protein McsA